MDTFAKKWEKVSDGPYTPAPYSCYNRSRNEEVRNMTNLLSSHLEDRSTPQYFCFSIRCEVCGEFWYSSSIPFSKALQAAEHREKKELYDAIYQREKQRGHAGGRSGGQGAVQPMPHLPAAGLRRLFPHLR